MRGNRRLNGNRIASRHRKARARPRRSGSPRRGNWRTHDDSDRLDGRLGIFDDGENVEGPAENRQPDGV